MLYRTTDWKGEEKQSTKHGFKTKREALAWEREMLNKATGDLDMTFKSFIEHYTEDVKPRLKENTWQTKDNLIQTKFLPYFGKLKMNNIMPQQIIAWQNEMMNFRDENGEAYSPVYLKTIHNQLSAIFNHAVRYYNLKENPCRKAGSMGKKKNHEMSIWTKEEYLKFADAMMDKPQSYYAFEMLYGDIIDRPHHVSQTHPQMPRLSRAAQFAPFSALTGYDDLVSEAARETDAQRLPDEHKIEELNAKLVFLFRQQEPTEATFTIFVPDSRKSGGKYATVTGRPIRYDAYAQCITLETGKVIFIEDITEIECSGFDSMYEG